MRTLGLRHHMTCPRAQKASGPGPLPISALSPPDFIRAVALAAIVVEMWMTQTVVGVAA